MPYPGLCPVENHKTKPGVHLFKYGKVHTHHETDWFSTEEMRV